MHKKNSFLLLILFLFISSGISYSATYTYDNANRLMGVDYSNGITINYTYDSNGNRISMVTTDVAPPTGSIAINGGASTTNSATVTLTLSASSATGTVDQMRFSNDNITWSAWEPFATTKTWNLTSGDGLKTVYAQFKDSFGKISIAYSASITLAAVSGIDLSVSLILPPSSANSGALLNVPTTILNNGTAASSVTYIYYYLSTDSIISSSDRYIGYKHISAIDGGGNLSVTGTAQLPANLDSGTYYIGAIVDPTNINAEFDETNNTASAAITINGIPTGPIDLSVTSFTPPATANTGGTITIPTTVLNNGTGTSDGTYIYYYLSTDPVITISDTYIGYKTVGGIAGGSSQSVTGTGIIPANLTTGTYYIGAYVDATNVNIETDETNNITSTSISISGKPVNGPVDLAISSIIPPVSANAGDKITVPTTIINNETGTSIGNYVYFYLSTDPVITFADTYLGYKTVGEIPANSTQNITGLLTLPTNIPSGTYYVGAIVDFNDTNAETDETNNTAAASIILNGVPANGPVDLSVINVTPPATANMGDTITVSATVKNNGTGTTVGSYLYYYLSDDSVITNADKYLGYKVIGNLPAGGTQTLTASVPLPLNLITGTYYIGAVADTTDTNAETDETNNTGSAQILINGINAGPVDLAVSSISAPAAANQGDTLAIPTTITNNGTGTSVGTYIYYYLSTDPVITYTDTFLGDITVGGLNGGGSQSVTGSVILPQNLITGTYYIGAMVDPTNANSETDETNNTSSIAISITGTPPNGPVDLAISSITPPASANQGDTITIPTTAINNGTGTSLGTYIYYYLSADPAITETDTFLGDTTIGGLNGGGTHSITGTAILPSNIVSGTYYIGAMVDPTYVNVETDETNNTISTPITIVGTPPNGPVDLTISSLTPPATANQGETITVPTTVANNGTGTSIGSYIYYYLSNDSVISTTDRYIGDKSVGGITGGGAQSVTGTVILPTNLTTGTYYIGGIADATNTNSETDETNNTGSSAIVINGIPPQNGQPDLVVTSITVPANAVQATSISVPVTITNNGSATSTSAYVYFYLSNDAVINSADRYLTSKTIGALSSGSSQNITASVYIPSNTVSGPYYLGVIVDPTNANSESDETNNTASGPIAIGQ